MKKKLLVVFTALFLIFSLAGCKKDPEPEPPGPFKLIITGIPTGAVTAGALLDDDGLIEQKPVATGRFDNSGVVKLYEPTAGDLPMPDSEKPWRTKGEYYIGLSKVAFEYDEKGNLKYDDEGNLIVVIEKNYVYTNGKDLLDIAKFGGLLMLALTNQELLSFIQSVATEGFENINLEANAEVIEILVGIAAESTNIEKYDIQHEETTIAWAKFKVMDEETLMAELSAFADSKAGQTLLEQILNNLSP